jgi:alpha-N-acetylglucosamine transferase
MQVRFYRLVCFLLLSVAFAVCADAGELKITFIGNMAFHITDGETTLLSDFPYTSGAYGYMEYEMEQVPEILDGVHLITHFHGDHWNAGLFQEMKLKTKIIAPPSVTEKLKKERVIPFSKTELMSYKGISVRAIEMPHNFAPEHFSYLVTWHGKRLYFIGDTETPADILKQKDIDVLFISPWVIRTIERQDLTLDTRELVMYHQKVGEEVVPFQNYHRMKEGESFSISFEDK